MHEALTAIQERLQMIIEQLQSTLPIDEPFGNAHNNWSFPGLSGAELVEEVRSVIDLIEDHQTDDLGDSESRITDYIRRLDHLHSQTIPNIWGNAGAAVPAFQFTINGLRKALSSVLIVDDHAETLAKRRKLRRQLRGMEAELKGLKPRTASLATMVSRIEQAHNAADQLPTDLESLAEAREKIDELVRNATQDHGRILGIREEVDELGMQLKKNGKEAIAILDLCETAYSAATSVGLAAAFGERSNALSKSMWFWIFGLVVALSTGTIFGSFQVRSLLNMIDVPGASGSVIVLNALLSFLSVGAPIWFAWLATKQIGQRFRLSEDYAFKAAVSRAYEGFRRETARFDKDMEAKLLASALARLDELPLRLLEAQSYGSPWHELVSSEVMMKAMREVPGFAGQVRTLASKAVGTVMSSKAKSNPTPPVARARDE